jgi:hypothetical protein
VGVVFARVQDPQGNIWWIWKSLENYDWESAFGGDEKSWKPTKEAMYVHDTIVEAMEKLKQSKKHGLYCLNSNKGDRHSQSGCCKPATS